ncbi:hypothetical protein EVAR_30310_1 [Eumeta japonica]|uniref:Uncharacterized protein n=1 Tax=Eumeta variegata TaxID=151549 RepID=A0A4C1W889_EUMVA|nr:hypothetical protein EVAR_30310_1 [Eumeta japonica]
MSFETTREDAQTDWDRKHEYAKLSIGEKEALIASSKGSKVSKIKRRAFDRAARQVIDVVRNYFDAPPRLDINHAVIVKVERPARALATSSVQYSNARGREKERDTQRWKVGVRKRDEWMCAKRKHTLSRSPEAQEYHHHEAENDSQKYCHEQTPHAFQTTQGDVADIRVRIRNCGASVSIWTSAFASVSASIDADVNADADVLTLECDRKEIGCGWRIARAPEHVLINPNVP